MWSFDFSANTLLIDLDKKYKFYFTKINAVVWISSVCVLYWVAYIGCLRFPAFLVRKLIFYGKWCTKQHHRIVWRKNARQIIVSKILNNSCIFATIILLLRDNSMRFIFNLIGFECGSRNLYATGRKFCMIG